MNKITFYLPYFELLTLLETSLTDFKLVKEEELEHRIKKYQREFVNHSKLYFVEYEAGNEEERDVYHLNRSLEQQTYLVFTNELEIFCIQDAEEKAIEVAEIIGTNAFELIDEVKRHILFIKLNNEWTWIPLFKVSDAPQFQHTLISSSKIDKRDQFFSAILKS